MMYPHCIGVSGVDTMSFGPMSEVGAKNLHAYLSDPSTWSNRVFHPRSGGIQGGGPGAPEYPAQLLRIRDAPQPSSFSNTPFTASADNSWGGGCLVVATSHICLTMPHLLAGVFSALVPLQGQCRAVPLTRGASRDSCSATQLSFLLVPTSSGTSAISEALQLLSTHSFAHVVIFALSAPLSQWNAYDLWRCQMTSPSGLPTLIDIPMLETLLLDKIALSMMATTPTGNGSENNDVVHHILVVAEESAQSYFGASPYPYLPPIPGVSLPYLSIGHPTSALSTLLQFEASTDADMAITQRRDNQQLEASISATYHTLQFKSPTGVTMDASLVVSALLSTMRLLTAVDIISQVASVDGNRLQWVLREPTCVVEGTLQPSVVSARVKQISTVCRSVAGVVVTHEELPSGGWLSCKGRGLDGLSVAPCRKGKEPSPTHGSVALISASPQFWQWLRNTAPKVGGLHIRPRVPGVPSVLEITGVGAEGSAHDWLKDLTATLPCGCLLSLVQQGTEDTSDASSLQPGVSPNNRGGNGGRVMGVPIGVQVGGENGVDVGVQWEDQHCIDWDIPQSSAGGGGADGAARADGGGSTPGLYNPRVPSKPGGPLFGLNGGVAMKGPAQITMHVCTADDPDELMRGGGSAKKSTTQHRPGTGSNRQVAIDGTWHMAPKAPRLPNHEYAKGYVRVGSARPQQQPSPRHDE